VKGEIGSEENIFYCKGVEERRWRKGKGQVKKGPFLLVVLATTTKVEIESTRKKGEGTAGPPGM